MVKDGEKSLLKLLQLLEAVGSAPEGIGSRELAAELGMPPSSLFRMLKFLTATGYAAKNGRLYTLGIGVQRLGWRAEVQNPLRTLALPALQRLARETLETVHLAKLDGDRMIYVAKVEGERALRMRSLVGRSSPLHCTGIGKAVLAFLPEDDRQRRLNSLVLNAYTPATLTSGAALRQELAEIRRRGYAVDDEEHEEGVYCVAAPVLNRNGGMVAAVSVAGAALYLRGRTAELAGLVVGAARDIGKAIDGTAD